MRARPLIERFWEKVDHRGPDECWPWTGARGGRDKRGSIGEGTPSRKNLYAHRVAYELQHGSIPEGQKVLHTCDNPPCCNPAHLFLGTQLDNIADMVEKGRQKGAPGERNTKAKLTEEKVAEIRREYIKGSSTYGQPALARKHGVSQPMIGYIVRGENWK